jgi:hypothetical protein
MRPGERSSVWLLMAAAGAAVLCCAGPTLLVLAATGMGAVALHSGAFLVVGMGLGAAMGIGGLVRWRRRTCARPVVPALHSPHNSPR